MVSEERDPEFVELTADLAAPEAPERELDAALTLRPRTGPQQVDLAVELLMGRFLGYVGVCAAIWFPFRAMMPWLSGLLDAGPVADASELPAMLTAMFGMLGVQTLVTIVSTMVVSVLAYDELVGVRTSPLHALQRTLRRIPGLFLVFVFQAVVTGLVVGLLTVFAIFCPPIFLGAGFAYLFLTWRFWIAPTSLILEDLGAVEALKRSWSLTERSALRWAGVFVLSMILVSFFSSVAGAGDSIELRDMLLDSTGLPLPVFNVLFVGVSSLFMGLATALSSAIITAYYLDTRIRREGLDLTMRLERLDALGGSGRAEPAR